MYCQTVIVHSFYHNGYNDCIRYELTVFNETQWVTLSFGLTKRINQMDQPKG